MSVVVTYQSKVTVVETLTTNLPFASANDKTVTHNGMDTSATLNSGSTPPATLIAAFQKALVAGVATIDLTALTGTNGAVVNFTGLKVQIAKFANPITNANPIVITFGAANPYLLGGAGFKHTLNPGDEVTYSNRDTAPDVAGGAKNIDISGTGTQALNVELVAG